MPDGNTTVIIQGKKRFEIERVISEKPYITSNIKDYPEENPGKNNSEFNAIIDSIKDLSLEIIKRNPNIPSEASFANRLLLIGLFFLPVFHNGGSIGYLLTPNFGYLLGIYPLINIIDKLNKLNHKIYFYDLLRYGILGISSMHIVGIIYCCIQILYLKQLHKS